MKKKQSNSVRMCVLYYRLRRQVTFYTHTPIFIKRNQVKHLLYTYYVPGTALYCLDKKIIINKIQSLPLSLEEPDKESVTRQAGKGAHESGQKSYREGRDPENSLRKK